MKPPYRVPTMDEIRAIPWNGLKVASTFAGGGGSSTGYRMAGCEIVYANELTAEARNTYAANMAPSITIGSVDHTCPTIMAGGSRTAGEFVDGTERRKFSIAELKRICGFPDDYVLTGSYADQWARCGNAVPPVMMSHIAAAMVPVLTERRLVDAA
jgi:site-specific DNA-cytosine methylase